MLNDWLDRIKGTERFVTILQSDKMQANMQALFRSKTRIASGLAFTASYWYLLTKLRKSDSEILRLAGAGSLMTHIVEISFYPLDTINSNSKVC
jgi:hypothetical protein